MKNIFKIAIVSIILMTSCAKDSEFDTTSIPTIDTLYASIETPSTRTYADESGKLLWHNNDKITVFLGNAYPRQWQFTGETGKNYGAFSEINAPTGIITANPLDANYAIYPYNGNTEITNDAKIKYTIPAIQNYAEDSFGLEANVMVAVTKNKEDNFLAFKNLCGYFEFSLYGDINIRSIEFKGNNGEKLAGNAIITATNQNDPTFVFENGATETITLNCDDVELGKNEANATKFWFVVPAITYEKGITITITDSEGGTMEKFTNNPIIIKRSTVQPLNAFLVETENVIPNNQIWYTSTAKVNPDASFVYGATIVSNDWNSTTKKGAITFDEDIIYSISHRAFQACSTLINIILPKNIHTIGDYAFANCSTLESIILPNNLLKINDDTFLDCKKLTNITIPNNVTSIGAAAFMGCTSLTKINIPDKVTLLYSSAFWGCTSLKEIYCEALTPPKFYNNSVFGNCNTISKIYVPAESVSVYKTADGWKEFSEQIVPYE